MIEKWLPGTVRSMAWNRWLIAVLAVLLLAACQSAKTSRAMAPIEEMPQPQDIKIRQYTVTQGDTLYSIAWRNGMDYHELASINNIAAPYTIYPNQIIQLEHADAARRQAWNPSSEAVTVMPVDDERLDIAPVSSVASRADSAYGGSSVASVPSVVQAVEPVEPVAEPVIVSRSTSASGWLWPAQGKVIRSFSSSDPMRKGIDIGAKLGDAVLAAKKGAVVYAGSGLAGYGQLIIVKHDENYLSAYAHNSRLLVQEGDTVQAGQKIAEVGSSGTDSNKLHFEIRKDGKPVDPAGYLPRR